MKIIIRLFILLIAIQLTACSTITQRHDFLSAQPEEPICGDLSKRQNAILVHTASQSYIIQAKSAPGITLAGFFFAPIFPMESFGRHGNLIRVYSKKDFTIQEKENFKFWELKSEESIVKPSEVLFRNEIGVIGAFDYSYVAELWFDRNLCAKDFSILPKNLSTIKQMDFDSDTKWSYQWLGNEEYDPKCVSR